MPRREPLLTIRLEGGAVQEGRVSVDALTEVLKKVQLCVKRLGLVLTGQTGTAKPGRIKGEVEAACNLDVVAIEPGSFLVGVDIPVGQGPQQDLFGTREPLGQVAIDKMLEGIELLGQDSPRLVNEFDYGVLVALRDASHLLDRGIDHVEFTRRGNGAPRRRVNLNRRVRERVLENITGPIKSAVEVKGVLREVDLEHRSCQIYPQSGLHIDCSFQEQHEPLIIELLDSFVVATGEATLREADGRIKSMQIQDIEGREQAPTLAAEGPAVKPKTGRELLQALRASGLVGMWQDRQDIGDSSEFARRLRERAQKRNREEQ
jgi:hypothetical protein